MKTKELKKVLMAVMAALTLHSTASKAQTANDEDPDTKYATELLKPGTEAPDFMLPSPEGRMVMLSQYKGRYVVLDFWASWCPDCRKDAPHVVKMYKEFNHENVSFIGVSFDVDSVKWREAITKYNMKYAHVSELKKMRETEIAKAYGVNWIPTLYLIDPEGKVVLSTVVSSKINAALKEIFVKKE